MATLLLFISITLSLLLARLISNWYKLKGVPGPHLAAISDLWRAWYQYNGKLRARLIDLHKKHGSVVRYGVSSVSITDPAAIDVIYGSRAGFVTVSIFSTYPRAETCFLRTV